MNNEPWTRITLIEYAAGFFLYTDMPPEWDGMDDEQLLKELERRAWEPLEYMGGEYIWQQIDCMAESLNKTFNLGVKNL